MPRIDDYINAKKLAVEKLVKHTFTDLAGSSGFERVKAGGRTDSFRIPFLNRVYLVSFPEFDFTDEADADKEVPIQEQVIILHYLTGVSRAQLSGNRIAYREIPGASFYYSAFVKRAIDPLKKVFGADIDKFKKAAGYLNGTATEPGDAGFEFAILPKAPLQLILWEGDDEFPAEANILFDELCGKILSPEDAAWLAGMLVYRLIAMSYQ